MALKAQIASKLALKLKKAGNKYCSDQGGEACSP